MSTAPADDLIAEVRLLHEQFFGGPPPPAVVERYVSANLSILAAAGQAQSASLSRIVRHRLDAEAVEFCFRLRGRPHPLTTKVQILYYLVEVRSAYYEWFVNERAGRWRAVRALVGAAGWTAWKWAKGHYLIRRYRLV